MKVGDLIKTTRFSVGVPEGALGLIIDEKKLGWTEEVPFMIDFFKEDKYGIRHCIYFKEDLEIVSEG